MPDTDRLQGAEPRVSHPFLVRYQSSQRPGTWRVSPLSSLGVGGIRFIGECAYELGERVLIQLVLPSASRPVEVTGRVYWANPVNAPMKLFDYGMAFETLPPPARAVIETTVSRLVRKYEERMAAP